METSPRGQKKRSSWLGASRLSHIFVNQSGGFLQAIKQFPWFSLFLLSLFSGGIYQIVTRQDSKAYTWFNHSIQHLKTRIQKMTTVSLHKKDKLDESEPSPLTSEPERAVEQTVLNTAPPPDLLAYEEKLTALTQQVAAGQSVIYRLQEDHRTLSKQCEDIHARLVVIEQAAAAREQAEPVQRQTETSDEARDSVDNQQQANHGYSVHAIIQGRAWLNTPGEKIVTVNIGSQLPPFGTVEQIDSDNKLVYFDQGQVIGPSTKDGN
jgi:hypothetical protein